MNYGFEYEMEQASLVRAPAAWNITHDGTLRDNGFEFVMRGKRDRDRARLSVAALLSALESGGAVASHRCSTHIHCDMTELKGFQRMAFLIGMVMREGELWALCPDREANPYCVPSLYNPAFYDTLARAVQSPDWHPEYNEPRDTVPASRRGFPSPSGNNTKYTAINVMTLSTIGTIELRHFCPLLDIGQVDTVMSVCEETYAMANAVMRGNFRSALAALDAYDCADTDAKQWTLRMARMFFSQQRG